MKHWVLLAPNFNTQATMGECVALASMGRQRRHPPHRPVGHKEVQ